MAMHMSARTVSHAFKYMFSSCYYSDVLIFLHKCGTKNSLLQFLSQTHMISRKNNAPSMHKKRKHASPPLQWGFVTGRHCGHSRPIHKLRKIIINATFSRRFFLSRRPPDFCALQQHCHRPKAGGGGGDFISWTVIFSYLATLSNKAHSAPLIIQ